MRCIVVVAFLVFIASGAYASSRKRDGAIQHAPGKATECDLCIDFAVQAINYLLNYVLDVKIIGSCDDICGSLNNSVETDVCNVLCDAVGVGAFVEILKKFENDIDPIYFCQLVKMCAISDCPDNSTCATIQSFEVYPQTGYGDVTFMFNATVIVSQTVGCGMVSFIYWPANQTKDALEDDYLVAEYVTGNWLMSDIVSAYDAGLTYGNWTLQIFVCEGACFSTFPHSRVLATATSWFNYLKKPTRFIGA